MNQIRTQLLLGTAALCLAGYTQAAPIDLTGWTAESYQSASAFGDGAWNTSPSGHSVTQRINGQPTMFYSDFNAQGKRLSGNIRVNQTHDNDYIGFVLGYEPGSNTTPSGDYLLVDWRQGIQGHDFVNSPDSPGGVATTGLAVSHVSGLPDANELWQHENLPGTPESSGVEELARGATLGNAGWSDHTTHNFAIDFGPNNLQVFVDGSLEIDLTGEFSDGRFGFYNFSQPTTQYSDFELTEGSFPTTPVPEPGTMALFLFSLTTLLGARLRRRPA